MIKSLKNKIKKLIENLHKLKVLNSNNDSFCKKINE